MDTYYIRGYNHVSSWSVQRWPQVDNCIFRKLKSQECLFAQFWNGLMWKLGTFKCFYSLLLFSKYLYINIWYDLFWVSPCAQSCPTLCDLTDCSPPGSSVHWISKARILEWVAVSCSRGSFPPRDRTHVSCISRWVLYYWATWKTPNISSSTL